MTTGCLGVGALCFGVECVLVKKISKQGLNNLLLIAFLTSVTLSNRFSVFYEKYFLCSDWISACWKFRYFAQFETVLNWSTSPVQTFASFTDFSHSAMFFYLSFQFVTLYLLISVCTQFHHVFWSSISLRIIFKYFTYSTFTIHSVNMTKSNSTCLFW